MILLLSLLLLTKNVKNEQIKSRFKTDQEKGIAIFERRFISAHVFKWTQNDNYRAKRLNPAPVILPIGGAATSRMWKMTSTGCLRHPTIRSRRTLAVTVAARMADCTRPLSIQR